MAGLNERGAGRKKTLTPDQIEKYIERHKDGETILSLSKEAGVSRQTLSAYFSAEKQTDRIFRLYSLWAKLNREFRKKDLGEYRVRIDYMDQDVCNTVILVDFKNEKIAVHNYTDDPMQRAFGIIPNPSWDDFRYFLSERCIPAGRFQIKQVLRDLGLDSYDPFRILEKTRGRIGEDDRWLNFTYFRPEV